MCLADSKRQPQSCAAKKRKTKTPKRGPEHPPPREEVELDVLVLLLPLRPLLPLLAPSLTRISRMLEYEVFKVGGTRLSLSPSFSTQSRAVSPFMSSASTFAPASIRCSAHSTFPSYAAKISAVNLRPERIRVSAPASSRASTTSGIPFQPLTSTAYKPDHHTRQETI